MGLSISAFAAKAIFAFVLNWMAANYLSVEAFSLWATFFSFAMVLSAGDLGVGQYILTFMVESEDNIQRNFHFNSGLSALFFLTFPVLLISIIFVYFSRMDNYFGALLCVLLVLKLPLIAYSSLLQVKGRLHEKRIFDAIPYVLAVPMSYALHLFDASVYVQLLAINTLLLGGGILTFVRCLYLGSPRFSLMRFNSIKTTLKSALPYLLNNASGILIYGGFVSIFGFYLDAYHLAVLAIYHTIILSLGYQAYEVIFRQYQLTIHQSAVFNRLLIFQAISGGLLFIGAFFYGLEVFSLLYPAYDFERAEILAFLIFSQLEFTYLLFTLRLQMQIAGSSILRALSFIRVTSFMLVLLACMFFENLNIIDIIVSISIFSCFNFVVLQVKSYRYFHAKKRYLNP